MRLISRGCREASNSRALHGEKQDGDLKLRVPRGQFNAEGYC
jgi:hypothetical protein